MGAAEVNQRLKLEKSWWSSPGDGGYVGQERGLNWLKLDLLLHGDRQDFRRIRVTNDE